MSSNNNNNNTSNNISNTSSSSSFSSPWWWTFGSVPEVTAEELDELILTSTTTTSQTPSSNGINNNSAPLQILDVRTESEYNNGHIRGAINCSFLPNIFSFSSRMQQNILPKLDKKRPVYAICLSAHRSIAAVKWLSQQGFSAYQLKGGMQEWRRENRNEVVGVTNPDQ